MGLRRMSLRAYQACQRVIAPGLRYAQSHYEESLRSIVADGCDWLDIGCGKHILPEWRREAEVELIARVHTVVGIDLDGPSLRANETVRLRVLGSGSTLPFGPATFDLVTANMVVEHLEDPAAQLEEAFRVLRPGGRFVLHTPNARSYTTQLARITPEPVKLLAIRLLEGRESSDVFPTYYRANTAGRITELAATAGFEVEQLQHVVSSAQFAVLLPLAVLELAWIRLLMTRRLESRRHTLIVTLRRPDRTD